MKLFGRSRTINPTVTKHQRSFTEATVVLEDPSLCSKISRRPSSAHRVTFNLDLTLIHTVKHFSEESQARDLFWQPEELNEIKEDVAKQVSACHALMDKCPRLMPRHSKQRQACERLQFYETATLRLSKDASNAAYRNGLSLAMRDIAGMRGFEGKIVPSVGRPQMKEHIRKTLRGKSSSWSQTSSAFAQVRAEADAYEARSYSPSVVTASA